MAAQRGSRRPAAGPIDRLRAICLALPDSSEKVAWGEPTWRPNWKQVGTLVEQAYRHVAPAAKRRARG